MEKQFSTNQESIAWSEMKTVYVAGPYSKGDCARNVRNAIDLQEYLYCKGFHVYNPLLTHFVHMVHHRPYAFWLKEDMYWLSKCDALVRIQGESSGADGEVQEAIKLKIPVGEFLGFSAAGLSALDKWLETLEA
jgi:hypothetical protein